jgi:hypothetical protein
MPRADIAGSLGGQALEAYWELLSDTLKTASSITSDQRVGGVGNALKVIHSNAEKVIHLRLL